MCTSGQHVVSMCTWRGQCAQVGRCVLHLLMDVMSMHVGQQGKHGTVHAILLDGCRM